MKGRGQSLVLPPPKEVDAQAAVRWAYQEMSRLFAEQQARIEEIEKRIVELEENE